MNDKNFEKCYNCSRCGINPWKQGCYALWGKSLEAELYKKDKDNGYICSRCSFKIAIRNNNHFLAEKYNQCPIYGSENIGGKYFTIDSAKNLDLEQSELETKKQIKRNRKQI